MKDSVGKWYKDGVNDLNVIPPHEAWVNIEGTMQDWPKHWYQSNFAGMQSEKGVQGWEAIAEQLEIQRNAKLAQRNFYIRTASLIAGIALIPIWIANVVDYSAMTSSYANETNATSNATISIPVAQKASVLNNAIVWTPTDVVAQNPSAYASASLNNLTDPEIHTGVDPSTIIAVAAPSTENNNVLQPVNSLPASLLPEATPNFSDFALRSTETIRFYEPEESTAQKPNNWFIGPTAILGTSELLNPLSYREDATTTSSLNLAYGISASRRFNRNAITADLLFNDTKSQTASINSEEVTTSLNYLTMALQYERVVPILPSATKLKPELNVGAGIFGSVLSNASVASNQAGSYYSSFTYRNVDFGGVLTAGTSVQFSEHFRFGVSARIHSGAINLFEGREKVPSKLFRTQSLASGFQAKLSYNF